MGYYTTYTLQIHKDPDNQFKDIMDKFGGIITPDLLDGYEDKWYDWEEDMIKISKSYPKVLFEIQGVGEETFDVWSCYFCNGKSHYREIQTYWEEFDEKKFYEECSIK